MKNLSNVNVYIDGFNLYHSVFKLKDKKQYRWLDLKKLSSSFIDTNKEKINKVYYFSAYATWIPEDRDKHMKYVQALSTVGIETILGKFRKRIKKCRADCKKSYFTHEEKKTDVNIAIEILSDAFLDKFDTCLLITGDSDICPAINKIKSLCSNKKIGIILPPEQKGEELKRITHFSKKIKYEHIKKSLLPREIKYKDKIIEAPNAWLPIEK